MDDDNFMAFLLDDEDEQEEEEDNKDLLTILALVAGVSENTLLSETASNGMHMSIY